MQTIGERLEEARKKKAISIREAAEATKIRGDYLQKFETNHFDIGLTEIYTRGFLRTYANFLKLPADRILNDYAALGRGEVRPRQPNREVYGRMDISVAKGGEASDRAAPPEEDAPAAEPAPARSQPHYPRSGGASLPTGPDPAVIFRYMKWGGGAVIALLLLLILKLAFSGSSAPSATRNPTATPASTATASTQPVREASLTLVALNAVRVTVQRQNPDESYGDVLFEGMLAAGETKVVPRPGPLYITASATQNLLLEINGRRHPMGLPNGFGTGKLPGP